MFSVCSRHRPTGPAGRWPSVTLIATIAERAADDIYDLDFRGLRRHLSGAYTRPGVQTVYILDNTGRILADGTGQNALRGQEITVSFTKKVMSADGWIARPGRVGRTRRRVKYEG